MGRTSARRGHYTAAAHTAAAAHTMVQRLSTIVKRLSLRDMTIDMRGAGGAGGRSSSRASTSTVASCERRRSMRRWWLLRLLLLRLERFRCEADAAVSAMVGERHCCARGMQAGQIPREVTHDENATPGTCYLPGYF